MRTPLRFLLGIPGIVIGGLTVDPAGAQQVSQDASRRAAIHPVADPAAMQAWLSRVPLTRDFPPDFSATLKGDAPAFVVEMTTSPQCAPCADLWAKLQILRRQYGVNVAVLSREEAIVRSGGQDRKRVGVGKRGYVRCELGGRGS